MDGRVGKSVIVVLLCLVFFSALLFMLLENRPAFRANAEAAGDDRALVEAVAPEAFIGPMSDYEYDLYRRGPNGLEYVAPPALDYHDTYTADAATLRQLSVATDEVDPASRETTLSITLWKVAKTPSSSFAYADPFIMQYEIVPATKTVILEGGAGTMVVDILPDCADFYLARRDPHMKIKFMDHFSYMRNRFYRKPVPLGKNVAISSLKGVVFATRLNSRQTPGPYKFYFVMVPCGANVLNANNWISNLSMAEFRLGASGY
ncbi:MAG: hypothetical protein NT045_08330 [Candidatus Aureabacteria bacterium]|nr:hypothetical protein [Candidatus Auribacterota bacterium]